VDRYSFIVVDLHHLLLAGLPAHFESYMPSQAVPSLWAKSACKHLRWRWPARLERLLVSIGARKSEVSEEGLSIRFEGA